MDTDKCIACGICSQRCPINVPDEFNLGISKRKAIYIKYDQTIPLKYAIDPLTCIYFTLGRCKICEKFCPHRRPLISTGKRNSSPWMWVLSFWHLDLSLLILPSMIFWGTGSRMWSPVWNLNVFCPSAARIKDGLLRPSDQTHPQKIAWLQCVGSRNQNNCGNSYCSNICCMSAVKQSVMTLENALDQKQEQTIFFTDLPQPGQGIRTIFYTRQRNEYQLCPSHTPYHGTVDRTMPVSEFDT